MPRVELLADLDRPHAWMLLVGGVPQSHVDLDDPRHLELEYVRRLGHLADLAAPAAKPLRVLHLGGGGLTLARYIAATRPGSDQLAAESDQEVADLVAGRLPLGEAAPVTVTVADAREVIERAGPASYDLVIADVFAAAATPPHVTSAEFTAAVARALAPSGIFAANIGDGPPLAHARGRVAAVRAVFRHACVAAEAGVLHGRRYGNLIVAGSAAPLPVAALTRRCASDPFPARVLHGASLDAFAGDAAAITDEVAGPSPVPPPAAFA